MNEPSRPEPVDLLVVGAGPTGIAIGAEAKRAGLTALLIDKGPLLSSLLEFPRDMVFFTTRERLEIAGLPFPIPEPKPTRRQAITYYQGVARTYELELASYETVIGIEAIESGFEVSTESERGPQRHLGNAVALATGYFDFPRHLAVRGEGGDLVRHRFVEPYGHFGEDVVVVGGGNSAVETAMELWRSGARVTLVHRGAGVKPSVKYWLKPDFENRVEEGSIDALYRTVVTGFEDNLVRLEGPEGTASLNADAVYVLVGYEPDVQLMRSAGVRIDDANLVPEFDASSCESNIPGLYIAGTLQAGLDTNRIFIENSREHSLRIVQHLRNRLRS